MRNLGKNSTKWATWERSQRRARPRKEVNGERDLWKNHRGHKLKKMSSTDSCDLVKKPVTCPTWEKNQRRARPEKVSDVHILKKKSAMGATWKRSQRRTHASWQKKVSDRHYLEQISDGCNLKMNSASALCELVKKVIDRCNLGKKQRRARLVKRVRDGLNLKTKAATDSWDLEKKVSDSRNREKLSDGATWENVSDVHNLKQKSLKDSWELAKKSAIGTCLKKISDGRNLKKKTAMCATWKRSQRRARPETEVSNGLMRPAKKSTTCAIWGKSQQNAQPEKEVSDGRELEKKSAAGATWKRSHRHIRATW